MLFYLPNEQLVRLAATHLGECDCSVSAASLTNVTFLTVFEYNMRIVFSISVRAQFIVLRQ